MLILSNKVLDMKLDIKLEMKRFEKIFGHGFNNLGEIAFDFGKVPTEC